MSRSMDPFGPNAARPPGRGLASETATRAFERFSIWVDRALRPGGLAPRRALLGALVAMAAIFALDVITGETVRLEALYVFPIASVALHCDRRSDVILSGVRRKTWTC